MLFPIDFAADVILPFIELLVILLPAVIFAPIFPLVWFPGIMVIANEVVATYTLDIYLNIIPN